MLKVLFNGKFYTITLQQLIPNGYGKRPQKIKNYKTEI